VAFTVRAPAGCFTSLCRYRIQCNQEMIDKKGDDDEDRPTDRKGRVDPSELILVFLAVCFWISNTVYFSTCPARNSMLQCGPSALLVQFEPGDGLSQVCIRIFAVGSGCE
jgi:hypothetical protein